MGKGGKVARVRGAQPVTIDGIEFHSKREARRYQDLVLMQQAGQITDLRRQVPIPIYLNGVLIFEYVADFVYKEPGERGGRKQTIEDAKGFRTEIYQLKKRCVEAAYCCKIRET